MTVWWRPLRRSSSTISRMKSRFLGGASVVIAAALYIHRVRSVIRPIAIVLLLAACGNEAPRQVIPWAWERREDLRFVRGEVAYLAQTITLRLDADHRRHARRFVDEQRLH